MSAGAVPYVILEHGHYPTPYQARCRRCSWRSAWRATTGEACAEHGRHLAAAHSSAGLLRRRGVRAGANAIAKGW
jgi:hypothetical protein